MTGVTEEAIDNSIVNLKSRVRFIISVYSNGSSGFMRIYIRSIGYNMSDKLGNTICITWAKHDFDQKLENLLWNMTSREKNADWK